VHIDDVRREGITAITRDDIAYARELGLSLKLIGTAERLADGLSVRVHPAFLYGGHPLASVHGAFNAVTVESPSITEITMSGPGAGGTQTASAVLGDVVSAIAGAQTLGPALDPLPFLEDVVSAFYLHMEVDDRPGVLAAVAQLLGDAGASIKSVVQQGLGERAQLMMVTHPLARSSLARALAAIGALEHVRAPPRAISVINEEFV
jgi:homoserine dehydrogenase